MAYQNDEPLDYSDRLKLARNEDGSVTMTLSSDYFDVLVDVLEASWEEFSDPEEYDDPKHRDDVIDTMLAAMLDLRGWFGLPKEDDDAQAQ